MRVVLLLTCFTHGEVEYYFNYVGLIMLNAKDKYFILQREIYN